MAFRQLGMLLSSGDIQEEVIQIIWPSVYGQFGLFAIYI
jgi:hypothetical protein